MKQGKSNLRQYVKTAKGARRKIRPAKSMPGQRRQAQAKVVARVGARSGPPKLEEQELQTARGTWSRPRTQTQRPRPEPAAGSALGSSSIPGIGNVIGAIVASFCRLLLGSSRTSGPAGSTSPPPAAKDKVPATPPRPKARRIKEKFMSIEHEPSRRA